MRPAHVNFMLPAPGLRTLVTHVFAAGDLHLDSHAVFGVKESLVVELEEQPPGRGPGERVLEGPWSRFSFDIRLQREH